MTYFNPRITPSEWVARGIDIPLEDVVIILKGVLRSGLKEHEIQEDFVKFTIGWTWNQENMNSRFSDFAKVVSIYKGEYDVSTDSR